KHLDRAEKLYLELAAQAPAPETYRGLFQLYLDDPSAGMTRGLALLNSTLETASRKPEIAAQARAMLAAIRDDPVLARDALRAGSAYGKPFDLRPEALHFLAAVADREGQLDKAEFFYRASLKQTSPDAEALVYGGLVRVLWQARKYGDIVQLCRDGLKAPRN